MDGDLQEKQQITAMLNQDNKLLFTSCFLFFAICFSCKSKNNKIKEMAKLYKDVSKKNNEKEYNQTLLNATDSIKTWINKDLKQYVRMKKIMIGKLTRWFVLMPKLINA